MHWEWEVVGLLEHWLRLLEQTRDILEHFTVILDKTTYLLEQMTVILENHDNPLFSHPHKVIQNKKVPCKIAHRTSLVQVIFTIQIVLHSLNNPTLFQCD